MRLIDADRLTEEFKKAHDGKRSLLIDTAPTVSAIPTARWKVFDGEKAPQCTRCGMWMPFARYRRAFGPNAREITDFCPDCGAKMTAIDECATCQHAKDGMWQDNGICLACREDVWVEQDIEQGHNRRFIALDKRKPLDHQEEGGYRHEKGGEKQQLETDGH